MPSTFEEQINEALVSFEAAARDGISWQEAIEIGSDFVHAAMIFASDLNQPGAIKKDLVLQAAGTLFDAIAPRVPLPLPFYLQWARPLLRPLIRELVLQGAAGLVEAFYKTQFRGPSK